MRKRLVKLMREDRIAIWMTFLDDPDPNLRTRAVQARRASLPPGLRLGKKKPVDMLAAHPPARCVSYPIRVDPRLRPPR